MESSSYLLKHVARLALAGYFATFCAAASADTCIQPWQARSGTSADDEIHAAIRDSEGATYLGGFENGILGVENNWPVGNVRGTVEKRAFDGSIVWRKAYESLGHATLVEAVALDPTRGRLVVVGRTDGALTGEANHGQFDLFVALLRAADGTVIAQSQFGDQGPQHPTAAAVLPSGDVVVVGYDDAFVQGNAVVGQQTMFMARYAQRADDPSKFSQQWLRQPNAPSALSPLSSAFAVTSAGDGSEDVIVAARSALAPSRGGGARLVRVDGTGAESWNRLISPSPLDVAFSAATSNSGRLYVAGMTVIPLAGPAQGNSDGFLMERDPATGDLVWGQQFGSAGGDWVSSLAIDGAGQLFIAGISVTAADAGGAPDSYAVFASTYSSQGVPLGSWQASRPTTAFVDSLSIVPSCNGAALLAGHASGDLPSLPGIGRMDAVVLPVRLSTDEDRIFGADFE